MRVTIEDGVYNRGEDRISAVILVLNNPIYYTKY